jgi:fermentation-respiration switch protein FrsA (DUF1100 family)
MLSGLAVACLTLGLLMLMFEESLIFFPAKYPEGFWNPPGLRYEDAWFTAADGVNLHGWYCPADQPRAVVLFAHGNAGNLSHRVDALRNFQNQLGCSILIFDYRGYGRSQGRPTEAGILADARAARLWLARRAAIPPEQIVLLGESIGGAVMVDLAAADGARGLILENTFTSLPDVAAYHFPWLPVRLLMRTRLDSASKIGRYHGSLLMCHGTGDTIVPFELAEKLYHAANEPKQLVVVPGGDHNDPPTQKYLDALDRFLSRLP